MLIMCHIKNGKLQVSVILILRFNMFVTCKLYKYYSNQNKTKCKLQGGKTIQNKTTQIKTQHSQSGEVRGASGFSNAIFDALQRGSR